MLTGKIESLVEIDGVYSQLTVADLHSSPFKIWIDRGTPGLEIARNEHRLTGMRIRQENLVAALNEGQDVQAIAQTTYERRENFRGWLRDQMLADRWIPKNEIRKYAKDTFRVVKIDADSIRTELATELNREHWLNPGRRKST